MTAVEPLPTLVIPAGPYQYVPRLPVPDATPIAVCDEAVAELRTRADAWVRTTPERKRELLDEVLRATLPLIDRWTRLGSLHEGLDPAGRDAAEETIVGPYIFLRGVRLHRDALDGIIRTGVPRIPGGVRTLPDGRVVARVMPDRPPGPPRLPRVHADVWMDRRVTRGDPARHHGDGVPDAAEGARVPRARRRQRDRPSARSTRSTSCSWSSRSSSSSCIP